MRVMILLPILVVLSACQRVGISHQKTLRRSIFQFDGIGAYAYECGLTGQLETGRSSSSRVTAGGCASCR